MNILYIGEKSIRSLMEYCSKDLLLVVLNDFANYGKIIYCNDPNQHPTKFWHIEDYIDTESQVSVINKLQVILAFIYVGGIVEMFNQKFRDITILCALQNRELITEHELAALNDPWFFYNHDGVKPQLDLIL